MVQDVREKEVKTWNVKDITREDYLSDGNINLTSNCYNDEVEPIVLGHCDSHNEL